MADNVAITPGAGANIAADDVSSVFYQRVKITDGTADAATNHLIINATGAALVEPFVTLANIVIERTTNTDGTSTALTNFGATASVRNHITTITVYNSSSSTAGFLDLRDGTAGSVIYTIPLPAGGGATISFPVPLRQPTTNTALAIDVSAAISTIYISLVGFKA